MAATMPLPNPPVFHPVFVMSPPAPDKTPSVYAPFRQRINSVRKLYCIKGQAAHRAVYRQCIKKFNSIKGTDVHRMQLLANVEFHLPDGFESAIADIFVDAVAFRLGTHGPH